MAVGVCLGDSVAVHSIYFYHSANLPVGLHGGTRSLIYNNERNDCNSNSGIVSLTIPEQRRKRRNNAVTQCNKPDKHEYNRETEILKFCVNLETYSAINL